MRSDDQAYGEGKLETIVVGVLINSSINSPDAAMTATRYVLDKLGLWTSQGRFIFHSEHEVALTSSEFQSWLVRLGGVHYLACPYRHPWKERAVRTLVERIRNLISKSGLPQQAWPAVVQTDAEHQFWLQGFKSQSATPVDVFDQGFDPSQLGRLGWANPASFGLKGFESKQLPVLVLGPPAPRSQMTIVHSCDNHLGFLHKFSTVQIHRSDK